MDTRVNNRRVMAIVIAVRPNNDVARNLITAMPVA